MPKNIFVMYIVWTIIWLGVISVWAILLDETVGWAVGRYVSTFVLNNIIFFIIH